MNRPINGMWEQFEAMVLPSNVSKAQRNDMRKAFLCGAAGLFTLVMTTLDPEDEPTEADILRMGEIQDEVNNIGAELDFDVMGIGGNA